MLNEMQSKNIKYKNFIWNIQTYLTQWDNILESDFIDLYQRKVSDLNKKEIKTQEKQIKKEIKHLNTFLNQVFDKMDELKAVLEHRNIEVFTYLELFQTVMNMENLIWLIDDYVKALEDMQDVVYKIKD